MVPTGHALAQQAPLMSVPLLVLKPQLRSCCKITSPVGSPAVKCPQPVALEVVWHCEDGPHVLSFCLIHLLTASEIIGSYNDAQINKALGVGMDPLAGDPTSGEGSPL